MSYFQRLVSGLRSRFTCEKKETPAKLDTPLKEPTSQLPVEEQPEADAEVCTDIPSAGAREGAS